MATPPPGARARSSSSPSQVEALPPMPVPPVPNMPAGVGAVGNQQQQENAENRGSFGGFLKRGKSTDKPSPRRSTSTGNKLTKRQVKEYQQRQEEALPSEPPQIPGFQYSAPLGTFDHDSGNKRDSEWTESSGTRPSQESRATPYGIPIPSIPGSDKDAFKDPYDPTASLTSRGRPGYASSMASTINSPRRVRRRNDPTPFNILVIGGKGSGKTSFINFLVSSLAPAPRKGVRKAEYPAQTSTSGFSSSFVSHYLETEFDDGEHMALTIWDSEGLDPGVADLQLREISAFLESKFQETLNEEVKVARTPGVRDSHIHAVFLLLDPSRLDTNIIKALKGLEKNTNGQFETEQSYIHPPSPRPLDVGSLDEGMDLSILKALDGKTTVIPVISKADTIPLHHVEELKRSVGESLKQADLNPLEKLTGDMDDEEDDDDDENSSSDEETIPKHKQTRNAGRRPNDREDNRFVSDDVDDEDISNQSVLNLSDSSSDASSATSRGAAENKATKPQQLFLPNTIISPLPIVAHQPGPGRVGRRFAWGFADPYNAEHCDFVKLRDAVFSEWRTELREASKELWYENWRTTRLDKSGALPPRRDLGGPPTTGRGVRMGQQMAALRDKGSHSNEGSPGGLQPTNDRHAEPRRPGTSPAAYPGQDRRLGASPAGIPRELDPRARASPAGLRPDEVLAAGYLREQEQRQRGSPRLHPDEFPAPGFIREQDQRRRGSPASAGNPYRAPPAHIRNPSPNVGPMPGGFPAAYEQRSEPPRPEHRGPPPRMAPPITGPQPGNRNVVIPDIVGPPIQDERRKPQVPWPLQ